MAVKSARKPAAPSANATVDFDRDRIAALAKALGHPARVKVVETLLRRRTCIGCDIVEEIGLAASTTSEHLRILKRSEEHTSELQSLMRISYAVFCLKKKKNIKNRLTVTNSYTRIAENGRHANPGRTH